MTTVREIETAPEPALEPARRARREWATRPVRARLEVVRAFRHLLADHASGLARTVRRPPRERAETLSAEILPLADACRFLELRAERILRDRRPTRRGRPFWLGGTDLTIRREPHGVVLVIGPANYPLLLPGVQTIQALVAGNAVVLKPGRRGGAPADRLAALLAEAGLPAGLLTVLDESVQAAVTAIEEGVDKVVLTGSHATGQAVLERLAPTATPAVMELSGCDAVFVRADADVDLAARALRFGMTLNGGNTCIAPRRVFVHRSRAAELEAKLAPLLHGTAPAALDPGHARVLERWIREALDGGARISVGNPPRDGRMPPLVLADTSPSMQVMRADLGAPLISLCPVRDDDEALEFASRCDYGLGATVFGTGAGASELANRASAGVVVINDMIVPTADPRVPFGGRGASGFGVTRGAAGLLEMTRTKAVLRRHGKFRPHLDPVGEREADLLASFMERSHARSLGRRLRGTFDMLRHMVKITVASRDRWESRR